MEETTAGMGRRTFMGLFVTAVGGLISAALGLPAVAYVVGPALQRTVGNWIQLGAVTKVEMGVPTLFKAKVERQTGWIVEQHEISAYVLTDDGRDFVALSNVCTHLGCRARWIADQQIFFCPCHNGVFDKEGEVVSGPPPRALDRYETKVEDGVLYVRSG
jgi:menaquinol-cytochrome c reductase iron-sulfur subunit